MIMEFSLGTGLRSVGMNVGGKTDACFMLFPTVGTMHNFFPG